RTDTAFGRFHTSSSGGACPKICALLFFPNCGILFCRGPMQRKLISALVVSIVLSIGALAQQAPPAIPTTGFAGLDQYRASRIAVFTDDFGQLARYREADAQLGAPKPGENRVVFFGDSITDIWKLEDYFPGKP